jgi:hypothetical protein
MYGVSMLGEDKNGVVKLPCVSRDPKFVLVVSLMNLEKFNYSAGSAPGPWHT